MKMSVNWLCCADVGGRYTYRLCAKYGFEKPNDVRALELMNSAARSTMEGIPEVAIGYGVSDEFR